MKTILTKSALSKSHFEMQLQRSRIRGMGRFYELMLPEFIRLNF